MHVKNFRMNIVTRFKTKPRAAHLKHFFLLGRGTEAPPTPHFANEHVVRLTLGARSTTRFIYRFLMSTVIILWSMWRAVLICGARGAMHGMYVTHDQISFFSQHRTIYPFPLTLNISSLTPRYVRTCVMGKWYKPDSNSFMYGRNGSRLRESCLRRAAFKRA